MTDRIRFPDPGPQGESRSPASAADRGVPCGIHAANRLVLAIAMVAGMAFSQPLPAQFRFGAPTLEVSRDVQLDLADNVARSHLERIDRFLEAGQWDEAVETLRRIMEENGERMIAQGADGDPGEDDFATFIPLREYCHHVLTALANSAPEALQLYRDRVDPIARRWYEEAVEQRDEERLRRVADGFFASSYADDALYRLGEIELERGRFTEARAAWERTSPATRTTPAMEDSYHIPPGRPLWLLLRGLGDEQDWQHLASLVDEPIAATDWLAYPDTDLPLSEIRARLVLVSIMEGSLERADLELKLYRHLHGDTQGTLGGRTGRYVDLLQNLLDEAKSWPPKDDGPNWTTFAGNATRDKRVDRLLDVAIQPLWSHPLPLRIASGELLSDPVRTAESDRGLLSYHPLIIDDTAIICAGSRVEDVQAFDLVTGEPSWPVESSAFQSDQQTLILSDANGPIRGTPRFTMTAWGRNLWVKLGPQATTFPEVTRRDPELPGHLTTLDLQAQKKRLYEIHLDDKRWGGRWAFEGPPVCDGARLYVMLRRRDNTRVQSHVACFDAKRGRLMWNGPQMVASAETLGSGQATGYTHNLLTLHQGVLYCNTNLGAVAALRADDGAVRWITRYPRSPFPDGDPDRSYRHLMRDLTPCILYEDMVIAAPSDCDRVFALDAATGSVLWSTPPQQTTDVMHLLGVGKDRLLASGSRLYWIDVRTGVVENFFPARTDDVLRGYGRGLLAGDAVYWPTRDRLYIFDQSGPRQLRQPMDLLPMGLTGGNLAYGNGVLLIASANRLTALATYPDRITQAEP